VNCSQPSSKFQRGKKSQNITNGQKKKEERKTERRGTSCEEIPSFPQTPHKTFLRNAKCSLKYCGWKKRTDRIWCNPCGRSFLKKLLPPDGPRWPEESFLFVQIHVHPPSIETSTSFLQMRLQFRWWSYFSGALPSDPEFLDCSVWFPSHDLAAQVRGVVTNRCFRNSYRPSNWNRTCCG